MTTQDYLNQNALGYEGDSYIHLELEKLCKKFKIKTIIETGAFRGATTKRLSNLAESVSTIEINPDNFEYSTIELATFRNVTLFEGDSAIILPFVLEDIHRDTPILFFLDAHWESHNPLLEELETIADYKLKPVIVIHDFKVPGRNDLGFDSYAGQDYDFNWIKESIDRIYGVNGYDYHYNDQAEGAKRGVIYIYQKA